MMRLVRHTLTIEFARPARPWEDLRSLLRVAAGDEGAEMQSPPIILDRPKEKARIVLQVRGMIVDRETDEDLVTAAKACTQQISALGEAVPLPRIASFRFDAMFIDPFDAPFHELVNLLKKHYLSSVRIVQASTDLGLTFDQRDGNQLKHINMGPMDKAQLIGDVLKWPPTPEPPDVFVFANLAYQESTERDYSDSELDAFMSQAVEWQVSECDAIAAELLEARR